MGDFEMNAIDRLSPHAHWLVRLSFAATFLYHGLGKLFALKMMAQMMGMPIAMILMVAMFEVGAGVLVLIGGTGHDWATRIGGLLAVPIMLGAISMVHIANGRNRVPCAAHRSWSIPRISWKHDKRKPTITMHMRNAVPDYYRYRVSSFFSSV
jgi:uncharacterized membrane protein YphA (DoxX/SURF4 family)